MSQASTLDASRRRRFVVLDRDGTLIEERHYLSDPDQVELIPGVAEALGRLRSIGLGAIVVTNQSGIGRGLFDRARLEAIHARLHALLASHGATLDAIYVCPHTPEDGCSCRKPRIGLVERAQSDLGVDPTRSFVVGDKPCDIEMGVHVGATTLLVRTGYGSRTEAEGAVRPDHVVSDVSEAIRLIESLLAKGPAGGGDADGR
jgi:histidinol-phosphate phosphatase family protein